MCVCFSFVFFFKQKTAYEIKECDWSSDVCSSDLHESNIILMNFPTPLKRPPKKTFKLKAILKNYRKIEILRICRDIFYNKHFLLDEPQKDKSNLFRHQAQAP